MVYCVGTIGNVEGLALNLSSVAMQTTLPRRVCIAFCGSVRMTYYLQMTIELLKVKGVSVSIDYLTDTGISDMYQHLIEKGEVVWLGNDDVVYSPTCLKELLQIETTDWAFVTGLKPDIADTGKYKDFSLQQKGNDCNAPYFFYEEGLPAFVERMHPDLGNCLIHTRRLKEKGIKINFLTDDYQGKVIGDDWFFGALVNKQGLKGYTCRRAIGYHLEKEKLLTFAYGKLERAYLERTLRAYNLPTDILNELKSV